MRKNVASQYIAAQIIDTSGAAVTSGTTTVYVTGDAGTQASGGGTVAHEGQGCWSYAPTQAETNYTHIAFTFTNNSSNAIPATINVYTVAFNPQDSDDLGLTTLTGHTPQTGDTYALANGGNGFAAIKSETAAILTDTAEIGAAGAGLTSIPWNASWDTEVQSEVNDGLVAIGLDHLVSASVTGTDITDNSIVAKLVSSSATADWDTFVNTTDSLQAARDNQIAATDIVSGGAIATSGGAVSTVTTCTTNTDMITSAAVNAACDTAISDWATTAIASASTLASHTAYSPHQILLKMVKSLNNMVRSEASGATVKEVIYDDDSTTAINSRVMTGGSGYADNLAVTAADVTKLAKSTV